jgi:hypothetical protein
MLASSPKNSEINIDCPTCGCDHPPNPVNAKPNVNPTATLNGNTPTATLNGNTPTNAAQRNTPAGIRAKVNELIIAIENPMLCENTKLHPNPHDSAIHPVAVNKPAIAVL